MYVCIFVNQFLHLTSVFLAHYKKWVWLKNFTLHCKNISRCQKALILTKFNHFSTLELKVDLTYISKIYFGFAVVQNAEHTSVSASLQLSSHWRIQWTSVNCSCKKITLITLSSNRLCTNWPLFNEGTLHPSSFPVFHMLNSFQFWFISRTLSQCSANPHISFYKALIGGYLSGCIRGPN